MSLFFALVVTLGCSGGGADSAATDSAAPVDTAIPGQSPEDCTADQVFVVACTGCGPTDACTDREGMCVAPCAVDTADTAPDCANGDHCMDGACVPLVCG